jgi:hypothetical protein
MDWMATLAGRQLSIFQLSSLNPYFPKYRKMFHSGLNRRTIQKYRPTQEHRLKVLLTGLAENPDNFITSIKTLVCFHRISLSYRTVACRYVAAIALKVSNTILVNRLAHPA